MGLDEPFPLEALPSRLRAVILKEFQGRCPRVGEVAQIPDAQWLSTPEVGQKSVEIIHGIINGARQPTNRPAGARLTDAELLKRLEWLQKELRWLQDILKGRVLAK